EDGSQGIIDLMLSRRVPLPRADEREHLIIEMKRPKQKIDGKAAAQVKEYAFAIAEDERFRDVSTRWTFWVVSNDITTNVRKEAKQQNRPEGVLYADDEGKLRYNTVKIKAQVFPVDGDVTPVIMEKLISELKNIGVLFDLKKQEVIRYIQGKKQKFIDNLVDEYFIKLFINQREFFSFQTFPLDIEELVIGYLRSKGIISSIKDITQSFFNETMREFHISLRKDLKINYNPFIFSIPRGTNDTTDYNFINSQSETNSFFLEKEKVTAFMEELTIYSDLFSKTGAVHSAAISNTSNIEYYFDDIGRHNVIDKCIGRAVINDIRLNAKILLVTCRISSEIISKLIKSGIPIIISRAPPTAYAVKLGRNSGITIIGFSRGSAFNVYSNMYRILD
ncbi:MAG: formate dehydrogenase accessory sulfurtransferase FdhD, partial [Candidatus Hodarchaeota archaeon]